MIKERTDVLTRGSTLSANDVDYVLQRVEMMLDLREVERRNERYRFQTKLTLVVFFAIQLVLAVTILVFGLVSD